MEGRGEGEDEMGRKEETRRGVGSRGGVEDEVREGRRRVEEEGEVHGTTRPPLRGGKAPPCFSKAPPLIYKGGAEGPPPLFTMLFQIFY